MPKSILDRHLSEVYHKLTDRSIRGYVGQRNGVYTERTLVQPVGVIGLVEETFVADGDHMVQVDGLDESRHLSSPISDRRSRCTRARRDAGRCTISS